MAFMNEPTSSGDYEDRVPILAYNAKAGRIFLHDRVEQPDGSWLTIKTDITMKQPAFAVDFGRLETGWSHFAEGKAPQWAMAFLGQPVPAQPPSPGVDAKGKVVLFKSAWRVPVVGRDIGGVREFAGNSGVSITAMNELHSAFEQAPEARAGKIPVVKMVDAKEVRSGQGSNFQPVFAIQQWVDRPAALGQRTVPPPGGKVSPVPTNGNGAAVPAFKAPAPPTRHVGPPAGHPANDPPGDTWDAPAAGGHIGGLVGGANDPLNDSIPFGPCWQ